MNAVFAVVPYRELPAAKSRLEPAFDLGQRQALAESMLIDVLQALHCSQAVSTVILVGNIPDLPDTFNQLLTLQSVATLNDAIAHGHAKALEVGAAAVLVVLADLPILSGAEIDDFIDAALSDVAARKSVRIAPSSSERQGTSVLFLPRDVQPRLHFGADSFEAHRTAYLSDGVQVKATAQVPDIDTPADVQILKEALRRSPDLALNTRRVLGEPASPLPTAAQALSWVDRPLEEMLIESRAIRDNAFGPIVTYSRKVFLPVTHLCRDVCHYCTFARTPRQLDQLYMSEEAVLEVAHQGVRLGCREALFTLGDRPEARYREARAALEKLGFESTLAYIRYLAGRVLRETGLLPHINAGVMSDSELSMMRGVSASMGLMLESSSVRLSKRGMPHFGSPDKQPAVRLAAIRRAGEARVPFTSGILIGIGETRSERLRSLLELRDMHARYGHLQEILVQNFRAKPNTLMANAAEPSMEELQWSIAAARLIFGATLSVQTPPNLTGESGWTSLIDAGADDLGGISPLTPDFVNPEAPWPHIDKLQSVLRQAGHQLCERLTVYPRFIEHRNEWIDPSVRQKVLNHADANGLARDDEWRAGISTNVPRVVQSASVANYTTSIDAILRRLQRDDVPREADVVRLFSARGEDCATVMKAADELRRRINGDAVGYVVNRNINYTNQCTYHCGFCAFSTGKVSLKMREKPYRLGLEEISRRVVEATERGATEVCLQGGIHPEFTGETYIDICRAVRDSAPDIHIHAFSPLEVLHGAGTLGVSVKEFLARLQRAGLATLPGTAAEILDDQIREIICPDKLVTREWLGVMSDAHSLGLRSTATIMYGHVETPVNWARHLLRVRELQVRSGGFTEFVPLPFVCDGAPLYRRGLARPGPTFREAVMMHSVARLVLHPVLQHIQTSWVKMGEEGARACLAAGADDAGGTLMNESISRAAGARHGQEFTPARMQSMISSAGRIPYQRTTLYQAHATERGPRVSRLPQTLGTALS